MTTATRIKWIGFVDVLTSVSQLVITVVVTLVALGWHGSARGHGSQIYSWIYYSPTLTLVATGVIMFVNLGQILCAIQLLRTINPLIRVTEVGVITSDWMHWNKGNLVTGLFWFLFVGIPVSLEYNWPLSFLLLSFITTTLVRGILTFFVRKIGTQVYPFLLPQQGVVAIELRPFLADWN